MRFVCVRTIVCASALAAVWFADAAQVSADPRPVPNFAFDNQAMIVPPGAEVKLVWSGRELTAGPVPMGDGSILFSEVGDAILRYNWRAPSISEYRRPSGKASGLMYDARGRLIACEGAGEGGNRRVSITDYLGAVTTLADSYEGKRLNNPTDLAIGPTGTIYFTDPRPTDDDPGELGFDGVFLIDATGQVRLATRDVQKPAGIAIEPRGRVAYVSDNTHLPDGPHQLLAFRILPDGSFGEKRLLFDFGPGRRGVEGITLDERGNVYAAAGGGDEAAIYVFNAVGKPLAYIPTGVDPTNCVFGIREQAKRLYITVASPQPARAGGVRKYGLCYVDLNIPGYHVFPKGP